MEFIIIFCLIIFLIFLYQHRTNKKAEDGYLSSTQVVYENGCLGYQSGVDIKIKSNQDIITIDDKCVIPIQSIINTELIKTKQLTEEDKSVVKRAIVGTVIAGPIGTMVGCASGIGSTKKTEDINIFKITYKDNNKINQTISFSWKNFEDKSPYLNSWAEGVNQRI